MDELGTESTEIIKCKIDLEKYNDTERKPLTLVPCGHTFCAICVDLFADNMCPTCRENFTTTVVNLEILNLLLKKYQEPDIKENLSQETYVWEWLADDQRYYQYMQINQEIIEKSYREYLKNPDKFETVKITLTKVNVQNQKKQSDYLISFSRMAQINTRTNQKRSIRRVEEPLRRFQWRVEVENNWIVYDKKTNILIEKFYNIYMSCEDEDKNNEIYFNIDSNKYVIDFEKFLQTNLTTLKSRRILRELF